MAAPAWISEEVSSPSATCLSTCVSCLDSKSSLAWESDIACSLKTSALVEAATGLSGVSTSGVSTSPGVSKSVGLVLGDCGVVIGQCRVIDFYRLSVLLSMFLLPIAMTLCCGEFFLSTAATCFNP